MFSLGNSLLVKPSRIWEDSLYTWMLRTSLRNGGDPEYIQRSRMEIRMRLSLDGLRVLALPLALPGASWQLPQLLCQSRRGMEEGLVVSAEIFPGLGGPRKDHF